MKISVTSPRIICENPNSMHNYFGWPSVARLQDGTLAAVASGFRTKHICPFGKAVLCRSTDEGQSWSAPESIIDTPLDDRDAGIVPFGNNQVIVTSFNNTVAFQRSIGGVTPYALAYLDEVEKRNPEPHYLGSTFTLSRDGGKTFSGFYRSPVTCPHGPCPLPDGTLLYVGRKFSANDSHNSRYTSIQCWRVFPDGTYSYLSSIANIRDDLLSCEPHAILTKSGKILVHIRVQNSQTFTVYQSVSTDMGRTFSEPVQLLGQLGGSPAHLIQHSSGVIYSVYGYRQSPYGIRMMKSADDGETWETDNILWADAPDGDLGYPCSVELADGRILTVFYTHMAKGEPAVIAQIIWKEE